MRDRGLWPSHLQTATLVVGLPGNGQSVGQAT